MNFGSSKSITGIATQGTGRGNENNFVRSYSLQYYNGWKWTVYKVNYTKTAFQYPFIHKKKVRKIKKYVFCYIDMSSVYIPNY